MTFDHYFKLSILLENGLIANDPNEQIDLCVYIYYIEEQMGGGKDYYKSNILVYTAEEINAAVAEYEQFKGDK